MGYMNHEEVEILKTVISGQQLWRGMGEESFTSEFEDEFAHYFGRNYVYAVNSGTSANEAVLAGCAVEPQDEVICSPCSFIASSLSVVALGAIPVFADVDPRTLLLTVEEIEKKITDRTKAIVVVHLFGQPMVMGPIVVLARKHNLYLIEDCAQAYDAYCHGKKVGTFGDAACFSLQQSKHITTGEGGLIATDEPEIYQRAVLYSNCGMPWYRYCLEAPAPAPINDVPTRGHFTFGHNHRMSELQAAVGLIQLSKIDTFNQQRKKLVEIIKGELEDESGFKMAHIYPDTKPNYWSYPIRLTEDTELSATAVSRRCEGKANIVSFHAYNDVNYLEQVFQDMHTRRSTSLGIPLPEYVSYAPGNCPKAEKAAQKFFFLNVHHDVNPDFLRNTARAIREVVRNNR